jgi:hypothetical protein
MKTNMAKLLGLATLTALFTAGCANGDSDHKGAPPTVIIERERSTPSPAPVIIEKEKDRDVNVDIDVDKD